MCSTVTMQRISFFNKTDDTHSFTYNTYIIYTTFSLVLWGGVLFLFSFSLVLFLALFHRSFASHTPHIFSVCKKVDLLKRFFLLFWSYFSYICSEGCIFWYNIVETSPTLHLSQIPYKGYYFAKKQMAKNALSRILLIFSGLGFRVRTELIKGIY